jgi:hypothetical protein
MVILLKLRLIGSMEEIDSTIRCHSSFKFSVPIYVSEEVMSEVALSRIQRRKKEKKEIG